MAATYTQNPFGGTDETSNQVYSNFPGAEFMFGEATTQIDPNSFSQYNVQGPNMGGVQGATQQMAAAGQNLQAPTAQAASPFAGAQLNTQGQQQWADVQKQLASQYGAIASGAAPSAAELMMKQAMDRNMASMMATQAAAGGSNYGAGQRQMLGALGDANLQAGQQMAAVRAQEQERAMAGLAGLAGQARGAEMQMATTQAQFLQEAGLQGAEFQQQIAMLNPQLQMQTMQLAQQYMDAALRGEISQVEAAIQIQQIAAEAYAANQQNQANIAIANTGAANDAGGGFLSNPLNILD